MNMDLKQRLIILMIKNFKLNVLVRNDKLFKYLNQKEPELTLRNTDLRTKNVIHIEYISFIGIFPK